MSWRGTQNEFLFKLKLDSYKRLKISAETFGYLNDNNHKILEALKSDKSL